MKGFSGGSNSLLPAMHKTQVQSLGLEGPLEKAMVAHSNFFAWRILWREKSGRLQWLMICGRRIIASLLLTHTLFILVQALNCFDNLLCHLLCQWQCHLFQRLFSLPFNSFLTHFPFNK